MVLFRRKQVFFATIAGLSKEIGAQGIFNFLMSDGSVLFAHCSTKLAYIIRQAPFKTARLKDQDVTVDFSSVTTSADRVAIIATTPLTEDEVWTTLAPGTLLLFQDGTPVQQCEAIPGQDKRIKI